MNNRTFISPSDLAERWGCHIRTIQRHCKEGQIPSVLIGKLRLIPLDRIKALEAEQLGEAAPAEAAE